MIDLFHSLPVRLLVLGLVLVAAGCQSGPRPAAEFVQQAQTLHQASLDRTVVPDAEIAAYFAEIGKRIIAGATAANANNTRDPTFANMQFHLVASTLVNAYGTGGGHVYFYDGLLQACETEEELAALLAVQYAHALDLDLQATGMQPDVRGLTDPASLDRMVFGFVNAPFNADQMLQADRRAAEFFARGGWSPAAFPAAYERLQKVAALNLPPSIGAGGQPRATLAQRITASREAVADLSKQSRDWRQPTVADEQTFRDLKQQARQSAARVPEQTRGLYYLATFPNVVLPAELPQQQQAQAQLRRDVVPPAPPTPQIEPN